MSKEIKQTIDMYSHHLKSHTFYITKKNNTTKWKRCIFFGPLCGYSRNTCPVHLHLKGFMCKFHFDDLKTVEDLSLNFIYFTTIMKQVIQLILITLVGTDVCVWMVFVWEKTRVPGGNPPVWLGDHMPFTYSNCL